MDDQTVMRVAIEEALKAKGKTGENPIVGAVIAEKGEIAARGHHAYFGGPHAEVEVLRNLGRKPAEDAVLYVTLEPCSTIGKTGKCTDAILASGIKYVKIGAIDPNPRHCGQGLEILKRAGVRVEVGILGQECESLNPDFNARMKAS